LLVSVSIPEDNLGERCTPAWVVDDVLDDSLDVALSLNVVKSSESGGGHSLGAVSSENKTASMSLG
jgi:hypothetical protein